MKLFARFFFAFGLLLHLLEASQLRGIVKPHAATTGATLGANVDANGTVPVTALGAKASGNSTAKSAAELRHCLANKRVVFVGTSTLRYEYLTLAYFAEYGTWPADQKTINFGWPAQRVGPTPLNEQEVLWSQQLPWEATSPKAATAGCLRDDVKWDSFYRYSNLVFSGHEVCDCYRHGNDFGNTTENRFYKSASGDFTAAYFQWWGQQAVPHGMCPVEVFTAPGTAWPTCPAGEGKAFHWQLPTVDFIQNIVSTMAPTHLIINADWWPIDQLPATFWSQLAAAGIHAVTASGGRAFLKNAPAKLGARQPNYVDPAPFTAAGWHMYNAAQIVGEIQTTWPNHDVFIDDYMHLTPAANVHVTNRFVSSFLCA
eukprot:TRINITY_DN83368_c0_g1_i1.p1 TRINITY_DN83368_c0_g1~~TRINITY_DN83368_c0_g1_i1.p1  ORF type:complete len:371 (+),score=51.41 TRINITY_DN83368_c0_g1_i1:63-1175(+)